MSTIETAEGLIYVISGLETDGPDKIVFSTAEAFSPANTGTIMDVFDATGTKLVTLKRGDKDWTPEFDG